MKKLLLFMFLLFIAFTFSCSSGGGGGDNPESYEPKIVDNVKIVDENKTKSIKSFNIENNTISFEKNDFSSGIKVGDILAIAPNNLIEDGILLKVVDVNTNNNQIVINFQQLTLDDVVLQGEFELERTQLTVDKIEKIIVEDESVYVDFANNPNPVSITKNNLTFELTPLSNDKLKSKTTWKVEGKITIVSSLILDLSPDLKYRKGSNGGRYLKATATATEATEVTVIASAGASAKYRKKVASIVFKSITVPIGGFPVHIKPYVNIYIGANGKVYASVRTSVSQSMSYTIGVEYDNGTINKINEFTNDFKFEPPALSKGGMTVKGYIQPVLVLKLYGVISTYLGLDGYLKFRASVKEDPWCILHAGIAGFGGIKIFRNMRVELFDKYTPLYECKDPELLVSPSEFFTSYGPEGGGFFPNSFTFDIFSSAGSINYSISSDVDWLDVSQMSGIATTKKQTIVVSINDKAKSLKEGIYKGVLTISGGKKSPKMYVYLEVKDPNFSVSPSDARLIAEEKESKFKSKKLSYRVETAIGNYSYNIINNTSWLNITNPSGTLLPGNPINVEVSLNEAEANNLPSGSYKSILTFQAINNNGDVFKEEKRTIYLDVKMNVEPESDITLFVPEGNSSSLKDLKFKLSAINGDIKFNSYTKAEWININNQGNDIEGKAIKGQGFDFNLLFDKNHIQTFREGNYSNIFFIENLNSQSLIDNFQSEITLAVRKPRGHWISIFGLTDVLEYFKQSILDNKDGSLLILGTFNDKVQVIKIKEGKTLWANTYSLGNTSVNPSKILNTDDGYIIIGRTGNLQLSSDPYSVNRTFILKINKDGDIIHNLVFSEDACAYNCSVLSLSPNDIILSYRYGNKGFRTAYISLDQITVKWLNIMIANTGNNISAVDTGVNGLFLNGDKIIGFINPSLIMPNYGTYKTAIFSLGLDGKFNWIKFYEIPNSLAPNDVTQTQLGDFLLVTKSNITKFSSFGDLIWTYTYGKYAGTSVYNGKEYKVVSSDYNFSSIEETTAKTYLISSESPNGMMLLHINQNGDIIWDRQLTDITDRNPYEQKSSTKISSLGDIYIIKSIDKDKRQKDDYIVIKTDELGTFSETCKYNVTSPIQLEKAEVPTVKYLGSPQIYTLDNYNINADLNNKMYIGTRYSTSVYVYDFTSETSKEAINILPTYTEERNICYKM
ncbi:BACON domain-containing protein [Persephonella sp.]